MKCDLDAKNLPYPCATCEKQNTASCTEKHCAAWKDWFYRKWPEVTRIFREIGGKRK